MNPFEAAADRMETVHDPDTHPADGLETVVCPNGWLELRERDSVSAWIARDTPVEARE